MNKFDMAQLPHQLAIIPQYVVIPSFATEFDFHSYQSKIARTSRNNFISIYHSTHYINFNGTGSTIKDMTYVDHTLSVSYLLRFEEKAHQNIRYTFKCESHACVCKDHKINATWL